jgi:ABC-type glycerol-3-phosphate transport system substrate-binding protein
MQWKSARIAILFFPLLLTATAGCRPTPPSVGGSVSPHDGTRLRIAYPKAAETALPRRSLQAWGHRQNVKLDLQQYDPAASAPAADVWLVAPAELPRWAAADQIAPLPQRYQERENPLAWSDFLPVLREQLLLWERKPYALPLIGEAPVCCYRLDWLQAPPHREALRKLFGRDLDGPANWEQYVRLAEYFHQHGSDGKPAPSLPPLPRDDADLDRLFYTVAACYARRAVPTSQDRGIEQENDLFSFHYDLKTGQPRLATPGFVHALKLLQRMQACRPPEPAEHPQDAFRAGRAVLCLTDAPWLKAFQATPALRDKVGVCPLPAGACVYDYVTGQPEAKPAGNRVPYLGGAGWFAVVAKSSPHADAAFDLLADLAAAKTSTQIFLGAKEIGGPTRTDQLYRARWDAFDLDQKQEGHLREALHETLRCGNLKNPAVCLRTPRQAAHRTLLVAALRQALLKGADAEKTLQRVADAWHRLDEEHGFEAHKADYRRSLGLLAK